jgi:hypothetical protein
MPARRNSPPAQALRAELSKPELLGRMQFQKTNEFSARGGDLREYPTRIGVEAAMFQVLASALQYDSHVHIGRCPHKKGKADACTLWVVSAYGGPQYKKPRKFCLYHSIEHLRESRGKKDDRDKGKHIDALGYLLDPQHSQEGDNQ